MNSTDDMNQSLEKQNSQSSSNSFEESNSTKEPEIAKTLPIENLEARLLRQLDACTLCGECLKWCPVYEQDQREDLVPRAKIITFLEILKSQHGLRASLLKGGESGIYRLLRKLFRIREITEEEVKSFATNLYECSTCGQCQVVCPAKIDTVELWENIRQLLVKAGYGPMDNHSPLVKSVKSYDNPFQQPRQGRTKWARRAKKSNFLQDTPRDIKKSKGNVLLFFGCTAAYDANVQPVAIDTVNIFESLDINYGCLLGAEKCCGSVLMRVGDPEYKRLTNENIDEFHKLEIDTLVTSCAGCYKTLKEDYPKVKNLHFEVLHTVEFLQRLLEQGVLDFSHPVYRKVTYHDPCHLGRSTGVFDAPRKIMEAIPGLEINEMPRNKEYSRCCGAGGGVKAGFPVVQEKLGLQRIQEAEETGALELVSACPFCYAGLQVGIKARNSHLIMKDVTSLVAESLLGVTAAESKGTGEKNKEDPQKEKTEASQEQEEGGEE